MDLSKLSDAELSEYAAKADELAHLRTVLEFRLKKAELKLMAMTFAAQVGGPPADQEWILSWARWAYEEATGGKWDAAGGPD